MFEHCVPLPEPGAPKTNTIRGLFILISLIVRRIKLSNHTKFNLVDVLFFNRNSLHNGDDWHVNLWTVVHTKRFNTVVMNVMASAQTLTLQKQSDKKIETDMKISQLSVQHTVFKWMCNERKKKNQFSITNHTYTKYEWDFGLLTPPTFYCFHLNKCQLKVVQQFCSLSPKWIGFSMKLLSIRLEQNKRFGSLIHSKLAVIWYASRF